MLGKLIDRFFRIDPRSLGLFRIGLGATLIADLFHRWDWLRAFYSNSGVLPNHNHLFVLREKEPFWSLLHAFSSEGENFAAFLIFLFFYIAFTLGWHARVFNVLALIAFVSLSGRNVLLDSHGNSLVIMLLAVSVLLPLSKRFSVDSFRKSMAARDEKTAAELNDRDLPDNTIPASMAALLLTLLPGLVLLFAALLQNGPAWDGGEALYYALHIDRYAGALGVWARTSLPMGVLSGWTQLFQLAELALLPLLLVPVARHYVRMVAAVLLAVVGATIALFFTYGSFGWALLACVALVIPQETWERTKKGTRKLTVYYDGDCGICLLGARWLKRLDARHNITFVDNGIVTADGNASPEDDYRVSAKIEIPEGVTPDLVERTIVVIDDEQQIHTEEVAMSEIMRALPFPWPLDGLLLRVPGLSWLGRKLYRAVASNRLNISVALGLGVCGIPTGDEEENEEASKEPATSGASYTFNIASALLVNGAAILMLLIFAAQSEAQSTSPLSTGLGQYETLTKAARLPRMMAAWDLWAPEPARENAALVTDAETRDGWKVDVLTGYAPDLDLAEPRRSRKGVLWAAYSERIHQSESRYDSFRKELRRYLTRGGYAVDSKLPGNYIATLTAYWVRVPTPPPGGEKSGETKREEIFSHRKRRSTTRTPTKRPTLKGLGTPAKSPPLFKPKKP